MRFAIATPKVWLASTPATSERCAYVACGFREEDGCAHVWSDGRYDDLVLMGVLREEWQT